MKGTGWSSSVTVCVCVCMCVYVCARAALYLTRGSVCLRTLLVRTRRSRRAADRHAGRERLLTGRFTRAAVPPVRVSLRGAEPHLSAPSLSHPAGPCPDALRSPQRTERVAKVHEK